MAETEEENIVETQKQSWNSEAFVESNKKNLAIVVGVIALLIGSYFGWQKFILEPKEKEAQSQMFVAERYFEMDSLNLAINGDGQFPGFEQIISDYGMTKSANLAEYYCGVCYLKKGEFDKALDHLQKFKTKDLILGPFAAGAIGDAYSEQGKYDEAIASYLQAANMNENTFSSPIFLLKAGKLSYKQAKYSDAVSSFEKIKKDFSKSTEAADIDKYISLAKSNIK